MSEIRNFSPAPTSLTNAEAPFSAGPHVQPSFDVIELLPPGAADKLRALRQRASDSHAVVPEFEQIREASMSRIGAENTLRRLQAHAQDGGFNLPDSDARVVAAKKHLAKVTDEFERLKQRSEARTQSWRAASGALQTVETWLRDGRPAGVVLEDFETPEPKLSKGEDILSVL